MAVVAFALVAWSEPAPGGETGPNPAHPGYALYQRHCAECHGVRADGNGPRAEKLAKRPADLTHLRAERDGVLRQDWLIAAIDGRRTIRAHGTSDMPVWGGRLLEDVPDYHMREQARIRVIQSLADYVISIQRD